MPIGGERVDLEERHDPDADEQQQREEKAEAKARRDTTGGAPFEGVPNVVNLSMGRFDGSLQ